MEDKINSGRLGLVGWIKARILEFKLRRRWRNDPAWRAKVLGGVEAGLRKHDFKNNPGDREAKPKYN